MNNEEKLTLLREDKASLPKRGGNYISDESKQQEELKKKLSEMHTFEAKIRADEMERLRYITIKEDNEDHPFHWGEGSC